MNLIFLVWCTIFFYGSEVTEITHGISVTERPSICKGNSCLNEDEQTEEIVTFTYPYTEVNDNLNFENPVENLNEKNIYFMATSDKPFDNLKSSYVQESQKEATTNKELYISVEHIENKNSVPTTEEMFNTTDVTELSRLPNDEEPNSTIEPDMKTSTTTKINIHTTQTPLPTSNSFLLESSKKNKNICFCDIQLNQCDINCCCDEDCTAFHFKVFTKCNNQNMMYDTNYCYKTNFIFGNNTSYEVVQSNEGLFCIVRDNRKFRANFKTKVALTTLETFKKSLSNNAYTFSHKSLKKYEFLNTNYIAGSVVWTFQNEELKPLTLSYSFVGVLCNSEVNVKYLVDEVKSCFYQERPTAQCGGTKIGEVLHHIRGIQIISNPVHLNKSELFNTSKVCKSNNCVRIVPYLCQSIDSTPDCTRISGNSKDFSDISCWNSLSRIQYQIWHNGSEGISKMEAYLWVRKLPKISGEFLSQLTSEVKYNWISAIKKVFKRSGNPGYLTGKPILAGRKVHNSVNGTNDKKEAIELGVNPKDWLTVLGSEKGICSSEERIPVNFRENGQFVCSLKLSKNNFSKEKCVELQNNIFQLLIGNDVINETKENYFNKFVATFGNSRVEETGDWVQVVLDSFPIISSQAYFKSNYYYLTCKNIITDLYIDVVYSNTGSFLAPQAKILGVSFQFGKHKDLIYYCDTPGCENPTPQYFKLSSSVSFVDITKPANDEFAEPLSLEVKLPHDFFYPFFSKGERSQFSVKFILVLLFLTFLQNVLRCTIAIL